MLKNQLRFLRLHIADKDDPLFIAELKEEIDADEGKELSIEETLEKVIKYK